MERYRGYHDNIVGLEDVGVFDTGLFLLSSCEYNFLFLHIGQSSSDAERVYDGSESEFIL
jgi:hypothetical protein